MFYIATIFAALTGIGLLLTTFDAALMVLFRRRGRFFSGGPRQRAIPQPFPPGDSLPGAPRVSIIKPVCGLDDELEENLESFARLRGVPVELIVSVAEANDPALEVVERVRAAHPDQAWTIVVGGDPRLERWNRKVARLIAAEPHARGEIILISDSNVRVEPDDVARTIAAFDECGTGSQPLRGHAAAALRVADGLRTRPTLGCVSNLFTGARAGSFGAAIESLHLLGFVAGGCVLAAFARVPCVVGKSMAISRDALHAAGGFRRFARVLAEDQAIALAVKEAGFEVRLSPVVVRNVVVRRTLRRALGRQVRWNKIRYAFSKRLYSAEPLLNPLPFALLTLNPWLIAAVVATRVLQMTVMSRATGARLGWRVLLVPVLDLLQFGAQFVPYFNDRVTWRGYTARIGPNTLLIDAAAA